MTPTLVRANAQACSKKTLTASSSATGKISVNGSFSCYKAVDEVGVEYKLSTGDQWNRKAASSKPTIPASSLSVEIDELEPGEYDIRLYFKIGGSYFPMGDGVTCTVEGPDEDPDEGTEE